MLWLAVLLRALVGVTLAGTATFAPVTRATPQLVHALPHGGAHAARRLVGADVSWPNCPKGEGIPHRRTKGVPMPSTPVRFVLVGLTNGPGFFPNPCITRQLRWVHRHHARAGAYALTTYPLRRQRIRHASDGPYDAHTRSGRLHNAGYAEATYNIRTMRRVGLHVPRIWVDVEPYPQFPWTQRRAANRAVIAGAIRGYRRHGYAVGIYTYGYGWREVVGSWRLPYPTWSSVGRRSARTARHSCTRGPSGGRTWIAQWWVGARDLDLACPAAPRPGRWLAAR